MSADYKNLFETKKDYSNLFSDKQTYNDKEDVKEGAGMSYKNLFNNLQPEPAPKKSIPVFPEQVLDARIKDIQAIDSKISTHSVISWIDDFDNNLKSLSVSNQALSERQLNLAMDFNSGRLTVEDLFSKIKSALKQLQPTQKKVTLLSKLLGETHEDFKLTPEIISTVVTDIRKSLDDFGKKAKYNSTMFLKAEMRKISSDVSEIRSDLSCALVAATYLNNTDDYKGPIYLEKVKQLNTLLDVSELQLNNTYKFLEKDMEAYESLKDSTIPFLYVKIQTLMNSTLDSEALNLINDINKL